MTILRFALTVKPEQKSEVKSTFSKVPGFRVYDEGKRGPILLSDAPSMPKDYGEEVPKPIREVIDASLTTYFRFIDNTSKPGGRVIVEIDHPEIWRPEMHVPIAQIFADTKGVDGVIGIRPPLFSGRFVRLYKKTQVGHQFVKIENAKPSDALKLGALQKEMYSDPSLRADWREIKRRIESLPRGSVKIARLVTLTPKGRRNEIVGWTFVVPTKMGKHAVNIAKNPLVKVSEIHDSKGTDVLWGDLVAKKIPGLDVSLALTDSMIAHSVDKGYRRIFGKAVDENSLDYYARRNMIFHPESGLVYAALHH